MCYFFMQSFYRSHNITSCDLFCLFVFLREVTWGASFHAEFAPKIEFKSTQWRLAVCSITWTIKSHKMHYVHKKEPRDPKWTIMCNHVRENKCETKIINVKKCTYYMGKRYQIKKKKITSEIKTAWPGCGEKKKKNQ